MTVKIDRLLTEVERQQKYLATLPDDFSFPLFNTRRALESQRSSGYRTTAAAGREIVDNAIEAGATKVHVVFEADRESGQRLVTSIAFIDDGSGMLPQMARFALSWGGGTHFDDPNFIGKFGFGLPNASINQARRVEVYTRLSGDESFVRTFLDIDGFTANGLQSIPEPEEAELPEFVQSYLRRQNWKLDHGTIVVWSNTDRLTYKRPAYLKEHFVDDFGVTYRYLLAKLTQPIELVVENVTVQPVDPLFLLPEGRMYDPPIDDLEQARGGGARLVDDRAIPVKYFVDPVSGERHLVKLDDLSQIDPFDPDLLAVGAVQVRVVRFPIGFALGPREGGQEAKGSDERKRFEIRKSRRGISFVRADREIETVDVLPRTERDKSAGLGDWPLLQSYAYHWGIEVRFHPHLDEVFGITHDKQSVRPIEDFWRVLTQAEVDHAARRENAWQEAKRRSSSTSSVRASDQPTPAEQAAQNADVALSERLTIPQRMVEDARQNFETAAQHRVETANGGISLNEARDALQAEASVRRYRVDYYDADHGPFFHPEWVGQQMVVWVNRRHPFFDVFYRGLLRLGDGGHTKDAVDVVLFALAKAELQATDPFMADWYAAQRKYQWSKFIDVAMKNLNRGVRLDEESVVDIA